jgi:hypothetical protein
MNTCYDFANFNNMPNFFPNCQDFLPEVAGKSCKEPEAAKKILPLV